LEKNRKEKSLGHFSKSFLGLIDFMTQKIMPKETFNSDLKYLEDFDSLIDSQDPQASVLNTNIESHCE